MPTILKPRLDVAFKSHDKKAPRGPLSPIRQHWQNFIDYYAQKIGAEVVEYLLTEITPKLANRYEDPYIPHRGERDGFKGMFYMQTVFPHIFSVDSKGWGADCSFLPVGTKADGPFDEFRERIERNESFFPQPDRRKLEKRDIFFACQLPHDKNVRDQSTVGVFDAIKRTNEFAQKHGLSVIFKGHPMYRTSYGFGGEWSDASIHDLIECASVVVTVNSGVGMEAVLHETPVYAFGNANYSEICAPSLEEAFNHKPDYRGFFNGWYGQHEDYRRAVED